MNILRNFFSRLLLIIISIFIVLVFLEIYVRFYYDNGKVYELEMLKYADKLKYQVIKEDKFYFAHHPNKEEKIMGANIKINKNGFRYNSKNKNKNKNKNKILMMGDSMTFGFGSTKTFSSILNKNLEDFLVINAGVGNTNTVMQVDSFFDKDYLQNPNVIILNFFINDLEEINYQSKGILHYSYLYNLMSYKFNIIILNSRNIDYINFYKETFKKSKNLDKMYESLIKLNRYCQKKNIKFIIHLIPDVRNLKNNVFDNEFDLIKNFSIKNNINIISGFDYFKNYDDSNFLVTELDPHLNERGHKLIASYLIKYIK